MCVHVLFQIQQRPKSAPPQSSVWPDQPWSSTPPSFLGGSPYNISMSELVVRRATIRNSTLLPVLYDPVPLLPLDLHLNCRLQVLRMIVWVRQVVPSTRLPSWTWILAQRQGHQRREWSRAVSNPESL